MLTTHWIQWPCWEEPFTEDSEESDSTRVDVASMMYSVRKEYRRIFLVRDALRDSIQPLLSQNTDESEPCSVWVDQIVMMFMANNVWKSRSHDGDILNRGLYCAGGYVGHGF